MRKHILTTAFQQNPNVGLYGFANNNICLITSGADIKEVSEVLGVDVKICTAAGTDMMGIFLAGNDHGILGPNIMFEDEIKEIRRIDTKHTALGNLIIANNESCLIAPELKPHMEEIKDALKVSKIQTYTIGEISTIGALIVLTDKGCLLSSFASEEEREFVEGFFGVKTTLGTVNMGSPYIKAGILYNDTGFVVGNSSGGPEIIMIDEALGYRD